MSKQNFFSLSLLTLRVYSEIILETFSEMMELMETIFEDITKGEKHFK